MVNKMADAKSVKRTSTRRRKENSAIIILSLLIALIGVVGSTIVFIQNYKGCEGDGGYTNIEMHSNFVVPISFNKEVAMNQVVIKNNGDSSVKVRVRIEEEIKDGNGNPLDLVRDQEEIFKLEIDSNRFRYENGYYYANQSLKIGEEFVFLDGIGLNEIFLGREDIMNLYTNGKAFFRIKVEMIDAQLEQLLWK